jgi:uncharacterized protein (TIGR04255 family)
LSETEPDFVFEKPPLVEIIAEVRWPLQQLTAIPGVAIDPNFDRFRSAFEKIAESQGFKAQETLPSAQVRELLPYTPTHRIRLAEGKWPVIQLGPGILTVNQVPPYRGWKSFRPILDNAFTSFLACYPMVGELVPLVHLELRYIDAFRNAHGVASPNAFIREGLSIGLRVPKELLTRVSDSNNVGGACALEILLGANLGKAHVQLAAGRFNEEPAVVASFIVQSDGFKVPTSPEEVSSWFDRAHREVRELFSVAVPKDVLSTFGARKPLD